MMFDRERGGGLGANSSSSSGLVSGGTNGVSISRAVLQMATVALVVTTMYTLGAAWYFSTACVSGVNDDGTPRVAIDRSEDIIRAQRDTIIELRQMHQAQLKANDGLRAKLNEPMLAQGPEITTISAAPVTGEEERVHHTKQLLPSSVWCVGHNQTNRICQFNNLYYSSMRNRFFVVVGPTSVFDNSPSNPSNTVIELTSLEDHSAFYFSYDEMPETYTFSTTQTVNVIETKTFVLARFHPYNIMHVLHDDLFNLYHLMTHFHPAGGGFVPEATFSTDNQIQLLDIHLESAYFKLLKYFTNKPIRFRNALNSHDITCFRTAIVGQSKLTSWYHYGFRSPQGPIPNKNVQGGHVRAAVNFLLRNAGIEPIEKHEHVNTMEAPWIVVFVRTRNRLLLNQAALVTRLQQEYPQYPVKIVSMEEHSFEEQAAIMRRTRAAIGLHGSILIMGAFMPPGAVMLELYPFAVPPDNYTPYRTMCNLAGMHFTYRYWANTHEQNNVMHPDWPRLTGGIQHLPAGEQTKIINSKTVPTHVCCEDPYWLFRIYQDTTVDLDEVVDILRDAFRESDQTSIQPHIRPIPAAHVGSVACDELTTTTITLRWEQPWNGAVVQSYGIWVHQLFSSILVKGSEGESAPTEYTFTDLTPNTTYDFWVRVEQPDQLGSYSDKTSCRTLTG